MVCAETEHTEGLVLVRGVTLLTRLPARAWKVPAWVPARTTQAPR